MENLIIVIISNKMASDLLRVHFERFDSTSDDRKEEKLVFKYI